MLYLTEIKCLDWSGDYYGYFYVNAYCHICGLEDIDNCYVPEKLVTVIEDYNWTPVKVNDTLSIFQYIYRKYFKRHFYHGRRVNWEKE